MKKNILMSVLLLLMGITVYAQEDFSKSTTTTTIVENADKYKVETNRFWSNWFVSVGGGAQMYFGDHNVQMAFGDRLSPALDIAFGKWFTPGIGVRAMYSGLSIKGATQNGSHSTGKVYDASQWLDEQKFDFMNIHGDVMFNASLLLRLVSPMIPTTIVRSPKSWWTVCMVMPGGRGCWDLLRPSSVTSLVGDSMLG